MTGTTIVKTALTLLFFALLTVLFLVRVPENRLVAINSFLVEKQGIVISLGTILVISLIGLLTTALTNYSANRREQYSRRIEAELKIAEFRQAWIDRLRHDLAALQFMIDEAIVEKKALNPQGFFEIYNRIDFSLNPDEDHPERMRKILSDVWKLHQLGDEEKTELEGLNIELRRCARSILRDEWARLKLDLKKAQRTEI